MSKQSKGSETEANSAEETASSTMPGSDSKTSIDIAGTSYESGDTVTFDGTEYTVVGVELLRASPTSGLSEGHFPVVYEMIGERKAYRAFASGAFYPIRQYGTPDAVVSKQRESRAESRSATKAPPHAAAREDEGLELSVEAVGLLETYVALKRDVSESQVLSELVIQHIAPEIERLRKAQEAIQRLPSEFLSKLASATPEQREKILAMLG